MTRPINPSRKGQKRLYDEYVLRYRAKGWRRVALFVPPQLDELFNSISKAHRCAYSKVLFKLDIQKLREMLDGQVQS